MVPRPTPQGKRLLYGQSLVLRSAECKTAAGNVNDRLIKGVTFETPLLTPNTPQMIIPYYSSHWENQ